MHTSHPDKAAVWYTNLARYKAFVAEHGNGTVAYIKKYDKSLAIWVNRSKSDLNAGTVSAEKTTALLDAGITPAQSACRRNKEAISQSRIATLDELKAFVRANGHAALTPSDSKTSLYQRVIALRAIAKKRDPELLEALTRLGVFRQYPDYTWECGFTAWREYVERTGDFRCEDAPPIAVRTWILSVREHFTRLSLPLPWLAWDRKHLRKPSRERACVLAAFGRLAAAGFTFERKVLSESDLLAARLTRLCTLPSRALPLRVVLRVLTNRHRAGLLRPALVSQLHVSGIVWCVTRQAWRQTSSACSVAGALVQPPKVARTQATTRKPAAERPVTDLAYRLPAARVTSGTQAVKACVTEILGQLTTPTSERQLHAHPALRAIRKDISASRLRSELSVVTDLLHREGKIAYMDGMDRSSSWSKFFPARPGQTGP